MNVIYTYVAKMPALLLPPPVKIFFCEVFYILKLSRWLCFSAD
jgi:hypothetical protein